jgi:membrane-bound metal-dependent hydrolase YbcI (DUF457 family)
MAQVGIHALLGASLRKKIPKKELLLLGLILGNLLPDADNLAVAFATLTGNSTEGLHRTFTHSFITALGIGILLYLAGWMFQRSALGNLGVGLGVGIVMHIVVDLLVWFDGVQILWPFPVWVNLWENVGPPLWWSKLMMPVEFLFLAGYLMLLYRWAQESKSNLDFLPKLRIGMMILLGLFVVFTVLVYFMESGYKIPYGAMYLVMMGVIVWATLRMRQTLEFEGG